MKFDKTVETSQKNLFEPGQTLGGRYQVISCLGHGGMGVVYHVIQMFLNKELALKTIDKRGISEEVMRRFQKEARTAFAVKHPNIIAVDDFGLLDDQTPFLVMELIRGETLSEKLKRKTSLSINEAIPMFMQICVGLAYAHELGVVHRDIKPSNIMIPDDMEPGTEGSVKIVDFGIATFAAEDEERSITHTTEIFGSPLYISPEQCSGIKVDHRADIYSLGCVIFETLTGTPPFIGESALMTMMKHKSAPPPTLREASLGKIFPKELEQVVATMLAKSPEQRYQSISAVAKDLAATMRGDGIAKPIALPKIKQPNAIPKPLTLTRSMFFGAILLTTLLSSTLAGFAAFEIKHIQLEKPIIEIIRDKTNVRIRAEDSTLPIDDELVEKIQDVNSDFLARRLKLKDSDKRLSIHFKTLKREQLQLIANAKWIEFLDLEECTIDNKGLELLAQLPNLKYLSLKATNFNDEGAAALAKCSKLDVVAASGTNLTDKGLAALATQKSITNLDLNSTNITDVGLKALGTMKHLGHLEMKGVKEITAHGLNDLRNCEIGELALSGAPNIGDAALKTLSKFPHLIQVILTKTNVSLNGLEELCSNPTIREIYIDRCKQLTDSDIAKLHAKAPQVLIHSKKEKPEVELDD